MTTLICLFRIGDEARVSRALVRIGTLFRCAFQCLTSPSHVKLHNRFNHSTIVGKGINKKKEGKVVEKFKVIEHFSIPENQAGIPEMTFLLLSSPFSHLQSPWFSVQLSLQFKHNGFQ